MPEQSPQLPEPISYLQRAIDELQVDDEIPEETDATVLDELLSERVSDLTIGAPAQRLKSDRAALQVYEFKENTDNAVVHFIVGYMQRPGLLARSLLVESSALTHTHVDVDLPSEFGANRQHGRIDAKYGDVIITFLAFVDRDGFTISKA